MDSIDRQVEQDEILEKFNRLHIKELAASIPIGEPGVCCFCETWKARLVNEICARCRDDFGLP